MEITTAQGSIVTHQSPQLLRLQQEEKSTRKRRTHNLHFYKGCTTSNLEVIEELEEDEEDNGTNVAEFGEDRSPMSADNWSEQAANGCSDNDSTEFDCSEDGRSEDGSSAEDDSVDDGSGHDVEDDSEELGERSAPTSTSGVREGGRSTDDRAYAEADGGRTRNNCASRYRRTTSGESNTCATLPDFPS